MALVDGGKFEGVGNSEIDSVFSGMTMEEIGDVLKSNPQLTDRLSRLADQEIDKLRSEGGIPEMLYKYKPLNVYTLETIMNGIIYLPAMSELNDPFEGSIPHVFDKEELTPENIFLRMLGLAREEYPYLDETKLHQYVYDNQQKGLLFDETHIAQQDKKMSEILERTIGIYSLTTERNNFLMWSHYANSHKGICIGFDTMVLTDYVTKFLGKVTYQKDLPKYRLFEVFNESFRRVYLTKSRIWQYEQEYRLVKMFGVQQMVKIPLDGIVEVILGCNVPQEEKELVQSIISMNNPNCELYEARLSKTKFALDVVPIK
jgi:hypothetical protein